MTQMPRVKEGKACGESVERGKGREREERRLVVLPSLLLHRSHAASGSAAGSARVSHSLSLHSLTMFRAPSGTSVAGASCIR